MKKNNNDIEIIETSTTIIKEEKPKNKFVSFFKSNKIKNQSLFKKGGYSIAITALVLAGLILFNWLVASLSDRFNLEFDMTTDKKNSISEENIEYIKGIDDEISITVCAKEDEYADNMSYYANQNYGVSINSYSEFEYLIQTVTLINKYSDYNKKINVKFVDTQSTEFTAITSNYAKYSLGYGDIIVTCSVDGKERVKVLHFDDIYYLTQNEDSYYAMYTITSNRLETALTSAIMYVTSSDSKKVAVLSGHSTNNYTEAYIQLLEMNNYEITELPEKLITSISKDYDAIVISAPSIDFIGSELDIIADFLENDGKLGKGLIFFADATCPALPNLYSFLQQWGIEVSEGILFETDPNYQIAGPSTIGSFPLEIEDDDITENMLAQYSITGYTVPMKVCEAVGHDRKATALFQTTESVVCAPIGAADNWADYTKDDKGKFDSIIQSVESDYDNDNNLLTSYVMAFSSVEFVQSQWASYADLCNQNIVMACTDRASHVGDTSKTITAKVIKNDSFANEVTASDTKVVNIIFMFIIPISIIIFGIVVFIRRRNAR